MAGDLVCGATKDLKDLRVQLDQAVEASDKPAIVELGRRIVAIAPGEEHAWEQLIATQIELGDLDRAERSLEEWAKSTNKPPAAIDDFRGDILVRRKDYANAERHWLAFLARKQNRGNAAAMYDKLADLKRTQERWSDVAGYLTKAIAAGDSATRRVEHAIALLHLRQWDAAFTEIGKASRMEPSSAAVKDALPRYERLQPMLPRIKALDGQLAKAPNDAGLLLDRARFLALAEMPGVALDDCRRAMSLQPAWMRPRIQAAEALLAIKRTEEAVALQVNQKLTRTQNGHVADETLRELSAQDHAVSADQPWAEVFAGRSKTLRGLQQFTLALADANAALKINEQSGSAHSEAALSLAELNQTKEALEHAVRATELEPKNASAWLARGKIEAERADFSAAVSSLTHSIELQESIDALREREKAERRNGQRDRADADLARIRKLEPAKQ